MSSDTALARLSEPGPDVDKLLAFFARVAVHAQAFARRLGLEVLEPIATDRAPMDLLVGRVRQRRVA